MELVLRIQICKKKVCNVFKKLSFQNIHTVISSGNILLESLSKDINSLETSIENILPKKLGFSSTTIVLSEDEIRELVKRNPFKGLQDSPKSRLYVTFLKNNPKIFMKFPYHSKDKTYFLLGLFDRELFSVVDLSGARTPDLMLWLEKEFGNEITTRSWKTVIRILNKFKELTNKESR